MPIDHLLLLTDQRLTDGERASSASANHFRRQRQKPLSRRKERSGGRKANIPQNGNVGLATRLRDRCRAALLRRDHPASEDGTLENLAAWIAPIATMIAAIMTAANLGARVTGWGFAVFTIGSVCWTVVAAMSGQTNLLATNVFLTLVNLIGIWRWLGRQRAYEDGGRSAEQASRKSPLPTLFTASGLAGTPAETRDGEWLGRAVEALVECRSGTISYVVVATGTPAGIEETLRAVPRSALVFEGDRLVLTAPRATFDALPPLPSGDWPAMAPASIAA